MKTKGKSTKNTKNTWVEYTFSIIWAALWIFLGIMFYLNSPK